MHGLYSRVRNTYMVIIVTIAVRVDVDYVVVVNLVRFMISTVLVGVTRSTYFTLRGYRFNIRNGVNTSMVFIRADIVASVNCAARMCS